MTEYNGHRSWNAWNVALWINNDESTYRIAAECMQQSATLDRAVNLFCRVWPCLGDRTPDGAVYNRLSIKLALEGLGIPPWTRRLTADRRHGSKQSPWRLISC